MLKDIQGMQIFTAKYFVSLQVFCSFQNMLFLLKTPQYFMFLLFHDQFQFLGGIDILIGYLASQGRTCLCITPAGQLYHKWVTMCVWTSFPAPCTLCGHQATSMCLDCDKTFSCTACDNETHQWQPLHRRFCWVFGYLMPLKPREAVTETGEVIEKGWWTCTKCLVFITSASSVVFNFLLPSLSSGCRPPPWQFGAYWC